MPSKRRSPKFTHGAADQVAKTAAEVQQAVERELEEARYEASLASRRYELVDPAKRHVARELEARWNAALERCAKLGLRIADLKTTAASGPKIDQTALIQLAHDLPAAWNAPTADAKTKQRLIHILIQEVVIDLDDVANEAVVVIHWVVAGIPNLGSHGSKPAAIQRIVHPIRSRSCRSSWPDRQLAVTMNRMRCKSKDGFSWTTVRVRELRERLGIEAFDPEAAADTISVDAAAIRLKICPASVHKLIRQGVLPATQLMHAAPWKIPVAALDTEAVRIGVREIIAKRPNNFSVLQDVKTLQMPGI